LPAAVVTLAHLPRQWQAFVKRFAPHLESRIVRRGQPYDLRDRFGIMPDVIILNYHKLMGWAETLAGVVKTVIWDEAQELRREGTPSKPSLKYTSARLLADSVPYRMGLTATPIYNYGGECFNVIECIAPGALGTRSEFLAEWGHIIHEPRAFGSHLRDEGLMLRRTREEVGRELPDCQTVPETVECDLEAMEEVKVSCDALARRLLRPTESYKGEKMQAASEFDMRIRQATGIGKAPHVAAFVELLVVNGEKVVLYGWHRAVYGIWQECLKAYNPVLYTGSESPKQKDESKRSFMEGDSKVLMISLRAGAGLDGLQDVCSTVVFGELDWSPGVHEQCIGRVFRDGQKKPVFAYYLLADEGSDPVVADILGLKQGQIEGLLRPEADFVTKAQIDPNHIKKLAAAYLNRRGIPQDLREESTPTGVVCVANGGAS
jgi:SNF2 family DNA or RNA helicase